MTSLPNKQRNILFVVLPYLLEPIDATKAPKRKSFRAFPYGLLSIATYVQRNSTRQSRVRIIDLNLQVYDKSLEVLRSSIGETKPDLIGLSMMFDNSYRHLGDIVREIKRVSPHTVVVVGGAAATFSYGEILREHLDIDGICFAEGESPFLRLADAEDMRECLESDPSWITPTTNKAGKHPELSLITNLDKVIDIDYSLVDIGDYHSMQEAFSPFAGVDKEKQRQFFLVTSRGCPYKCIFCATSGTLYAHRIRYASIDCIVKHVERLVSQCGMNILTIYDDQLLLNKGRAKELFRRLAPFKLRIECPNGLSVAFIDEELATLMKMAGMDTIPLAIESGSPHVLREIIHKPLDLKMVKPVIRILRQNDFFIQGFFVIGLPGESPGHRAETLQFIKDVELDWSGISLATPVRGSELYRICIEKGYIDKNMQIGDIRINEYIIRTPDSNPAQIAREAYLMNLDANFVNNYRMRIGDLQTAANCFTDVIKRYANHAFAYYFLAKAQDGLRVPRDIVTRNIQKFHEIVASEEIWKDYATYFHILPQ